jgi:hypothetical protein
MVQDGMHRKADPRSITKKSNETYLKMEMDP